MRLVVAAAACLALACGNKQDSPPAPSAGGSAVPAGAASDPWNKPAVAADAAAAPVADAPCNDDEIKKHIDNGLAQSSAYLAALERRTARWKKDCEAAKHDLLALEPDATRFLEAMLAFKAWGEGLSPACRKRVEELGEQSATTKDVEKRTPAIEARVTPMLERCKDHPGFADAAAKGLRVLRKKHASQ